MMKPILFLLLLPAFLLFGQSFENSEVKDESDIYYVALKHYLTKVKVQGSIFIEENQQESFELPAEINGVTLKILTRGEILNRAKKEKILIHRIVPLRFDEGTFYVSILPFNAKYSQRVLNMVNQGGLKVMFTYNCDSSKLELMD